MWQLRADLLSPLHLPHLPWLSLRQTVERNMRMVRRAIAAYAEDESRPEDLMRLYDIILQNYAEMNTIEILQVRRPADAQCLCRLLLSSSRSPTTRAPTHHPSTFPTAGRPGLYGRVGGPHTVLQSATVRRARQEACLPCVCL